VITPNGDGANDALQVSLSLLKLLEPARLRLEIFGLDGQRVRRAVDRPSTSGNLTLSWDGRDDAGRVVPPGSYVYQIRVDADASNARHHGIVSVAY
jgi:flagellar hook assembly protein FlgD